MLGYAVWATAAASFRPQGSPRLPGVLLLRVPRLSRLRVRCERAPHAVVVGMGIRGV